MCVEYPCPKHKVSIITVEIAKNYVCNSTWGVLVSIIPLEVHLGIGLVFIYCDYLNQ